MNFVNKKEKDMENMPERIERTTIYESEHVCLYNKSSGQLHYVPEDFVIICKYNCGAL